MHEVITYVFTVHMKYIAIACANNLAGTIDFNNSDQLQSAHVIDIQETLPLPLQYEYYSSESACLFSPCLLASPNMNIIHSLWKTRKYFSYQFVCNQQMESGAKDEGSI